MKFSNKQISSLYSKQEESTVFNRLLNDAVLTTRLFSIYGTGNWRDESEDSPWNSLYSFENLGKIPTRWSAQVGFEPMLSAAPDQWSYITCSVTTRLLFSHLSSMLCFFYTTLAPSPFARNQKQLQCVTVTPHSYISSLNFLVVYIVFCWYSLSCNSSKIFSRN